MATVDDLKEETTLKGLDKENNYGVSANVTSVILIGGKKIIKTIWNPLFYFWF